MPIVEPLYVVMDNQTGTRVGKPLSRKAAHRKADRLDLEYGAVRYTVKPIKENAQKTTFKKFLIERFDEYPDDVQDEPSKQEETVQVQPEIKADIVDILRGHKAGARNEVMYGILKSDNEKDSFNRYFNRLNQKYGMDAIKNSRSFRNSFTIFFHTPNVKPGFFLEVNARFTDPMVAREVFAELTSKFKKKI